MNLRDIVARLGGEAVGEVAAPLTGVATLDSAGPSDIAFLANPKYRGRLASTKAGAVILGPGDREAASIPRIVAENPYAYYARTVALFHPEAPIAAGIHPSAQVHRDAKVDPGASPSPKVLVISSTSDDSSAAGSASSIGTSATWCPAALSRSTAVEANPSALPVCDAHSTVTCRPAGEWDSGPAAARE